MNRPLSIVYITPCELDRRTGAAVNESEFIRGLLACEAADAHAVACCREDVNAPEDLPVEYVTRYRSHGGKLHRVPGFYWRMLRNGLRAIRQHDPDLVLFRLSNVPLVETLIYLLAGKPIAIKTIISPEPVLRKKPGWWARPAAWLAKKLDAFLVRRSVAVDTVCNAWAEWIRATIPNRGGELYVIPNGTHTARYILPQQHAVRSATAETKKPRLLFAGTFRPYFALDALIDAVALLPPEQRDFEIVMAGTGPDEERLREHMRAAGVEDVFTFTGWVEYEQLPALMWTCDIGIDLLELYVDWGNGRGSHASFSQKSAQYLAAGLPIIAWHLDGAEFIAENNLGWTVPHRDLPALADRIAQAAEMARAGQLEDMRQRGIRFAQEERSYDSVAAQRCRIYRQALAA